MNPILTAFCSGLRLIVFRLACQSYPDAPIIPRLYLYYNTRLAFCQEVFLVFCWRCDSNAHHPIADSTDDTSHRWENSTRTSRMAFWGFPPTDGHHLCFVPLLYHNLGNLSRGFRNFYSILLHFLLATLQTYSGIRLEVVTSPLDIISISQITRFVKYFFQKFSVSTR